MKVVIIGAGVVGVTTAYFAARRGHQVTLLDRNAEPAAGASFANAGQLSYSYTDALADPKILPRLPAMLLGRDAGMRILPDPALLPWGLRFLRECTRARSDANTVKLLQLAADSAQALEALLREVTIEFDHRAAGKLMLTASLRTLAGLRRRAELKRACGVRVDIVDAGECRALEPALAGWGSRIVGGVYARGDDAGDARAFTRGLYDHLRNSGVCRVERGVEALGLLRHRGRPGHRVAGVRTRDGEIAADAVIVCAGAGTPALLRGSGLCVPIYPLKGYSVTYESGSNPPQASITDLDRRIVFANLNGRIRLAGLADCVGMDSSIDAGRVGDLIRLGRAAMPHAADFDAPSQVWAGLRPTTPSGLPLVGSTKLRGLYLNAGHGALGWTLACGTARQVAQQLDAGAAQ